jgi:putative FmdB family regulatory protein
MPIYEYVCESCGSTSEAIQRLGDPPLTECAKCGGALRKKVSAPAFQFKGSGWYITDYARKGGETGKSSGSSDSGGSDSGGDSVASSAKKVETTSEPAKTDKKDSKT